MIVQYFDDDFRIRSALYLQCKERANKLQCYIYDNIWEEPGSLLNEIATHLNNGNECTLFTGDDSRWGQQRWIYALTHFRRWVENNKPEKLMKEQHNGILKYFPSTEDVWISDEDENFIIETLLSILDLADL